MSQFVVVTGATISGEIDQLLVASDHTAAKITQETTGLAIGAGQGNHESGIHQSDEKSTS
jgi:hypothetical protein